MTEARQQDRPSRIVDMPTVRPDRRPRELRDAIHVREEASKRLGAGPRRANAVSGWDLVQSLAPARLDILLGQYVEQLAHHAGTPVWPWDELVRLAVIAGVDLDGAIRARIATTPTGRPEDAPTRGGFVFSLRDDPEAYQREQARLAAELADLRAELETTSADGDGVIAATPSSSV